MNKIRRSIYGVYYECRKVWDGYPGLVRFFANEYECGIPRHKFFEDEAFYSLIDLRDNIRR
jgi:hypothetical protein